RELARTALEAKAKDSTTITRLPIDRAFVMKGFGTVITGTLIGGTITRDEELELLPAGKGVRVRGIQVHGAATDRARAGERTAINLANIATDDLARGMMLTKPGMLEPTHTIDVRLQLLPDARPLKHLS